MIILIQIYLTTILISEHSSHTDVDYIRTYCKTIWNKVCTNMYTASEQIGIFLCNGHKGQIQL